MTVTSRATGTPRLPKTAAALGLAGALALSAAAGASAGTGEPDRLSGDPVSAGIHQDNAPALEPGTQYTDSIASEPMYYRISRAQAESVLHAGVTAYTEHRERIDLSLRTLDGEECDSTRMSQTSRSWEDAVFPRTGQVTSFSDRDWEAGCNEDSEILLAVEADDAEAEGEPFELLIAEEPLPDNLEDLGEPEDDLEWQEMPRDRNFDDPESQHSTEHGTSLNAAAPLEPGITYDQEIAPGQTHIYRLPADWNEQLQAEVFFPEPGSALSDDLQNHRTSAELRLISPHRGTVGGQMFGVSDHESSSRIDRSSATMLHNAVAPLHWNHREDFRDENTYASLPGDYYIVVTAEAVEDEEDSFTIPYRLTTDTFPVGAAESPEYSEELVTPVGAQEIVDCDPDSGVSCVPDEDEDAQAQALETEQTGGGGIGPGTTSILAILGTAGLLMMAAGALFLVRTMRAAGNGGLD